MSRRIRNLRYPGKDLPLSSPEDVTRFFEADGLLSCFKDGSLQVWLQQNGFSDYHERVATLNAQAPAEVIVPALGAIFGRADVASAWVEALVLREAPAPETTGPGNVPELSSPTESPRYLRERSRTLVAGFGDGTVQAYSTDTWQVTWSYKYPKASCLSSDATPVGVAPNGSHVAYLIGDLVVSSKQKLVWVDAGGREPEVVLSTSARHAAMAPDGSFIVFSEGNSILAVEPSRQNVIDRWLLPDDKFSWVSITPDGQHVAVIYRDGTVIVRAVGQQSQQVKLMAADKLDGAVLGPDGKSVTYSYYVSGAFGLHYDFETSQQIWKSNLAGHGSLIGIAASPDGEYVAFYSAVGGVVLHDAKTCDVLHKWDLPGLLVDAAFAEGRPWLAAGTTEGFISVWDTQSGALVGTPRVGDGSVFLIDDKHRVRFLRFLSTSVTRSSS